MLNRLRLFLTLGVGTIGAIVGIGSGLTNIFGGSGGGGGGGGSSPYQYIPSGQGGADSSWQQLLQSLTSSGQGAASMISPDIAAAYRAMAGIDPSGMTNAANQQGGYLGNLAANEDAMHNILSNQAGVNQTAQGSLMNAGNQLWQTSLDPQNALRNQQQQQVTDASRAATSARGIGMSGNAAGIENQDVSNFLNNWQQQQLQRQATGLQGMTGAYAQAGAQGQNVGANLSGAANLGTAAAGNIGASGMDPYLAMLQGAQQPFNAANAYAGSQSSGVYQPLGGIMSQIIPYLNFGMGASQNAFGQQQTGLNSLTTGLGQLGGNSSNPNMGAINWNTIMDQFNPNFGGGQGNYNTGGYGGSQWSDGSGGP